MNVLFLIRKDLSVSSKEGMKQATYSQMVQKGKKVNYVTNRAKYYKGVNMDKEYKGILCIILVTFWVI